MKIHRFNSQRKRKGFSLIELQVALVIFSLVSIGVIASMILFAKLLRNITDHQEFDSTVSISMSAIGGDVRMAETFSLSSPSEITISRTDGASVQYFLEKQSDGSFSLIRNDDSTSRRIANNVDSLKFELSGTNNRYLDLNMALKKSVSDSRDSERFLEMRFTRRNN
jgi:prepilin-type N-terminal cleavage/methylation domain-containing protein